MITKLRVKNFKQFESAEIELGNSVVFVGPNNSGKTTALQALALWELGLRRWNEKRSGRASPEKRPGVTINRKDLIAIPVPGSNLLWRNLHVRDVSRSKDAQRTQNVLISVVVDGVSKDAPWTCGFEFDYANEESFYCRPLRVGEGQPAPRMPVPEAANLIRVAYLPPMSGLSDREFLKQVGEVSVLVGQGQTAQVLRNLCYQLHQGETNGQHALWNKLRGQINDLFGAMMDDPKYIAERSEIVMTYQAGKTRLDLSSSGRGLQQTLLLLAYLYHNPRSILLLDEPDAHLEILRQRQIYQLLTTAAREQGSQLIAASHSEVVLNEAADRDVVVAFVGKPHRIDDRSGKSQVLKALNEIGFDQYELAQQVGWVLYVEGPTDLAILTAFAKLLGHEALKQLERPFVHYVYNQPSRAQTHFYGIREAKSNLVGLALFDRLDKEAKSDSSLRITQWKKREIENYLCIEDVLVDFARGDEAQDMFSKDDAKKREQTMRECIAELTKALEITRKPSPWSSDIKATDEFLDPLFENFYKKLGLPNLMQKTDYHILVNHLPASMIDPEVTAVLNQIVAVANSAQPE